MLMLMLITRKLWRAPYLRIVLLVFLLTVDLCIDGEHARDLQ
jgi:hypothetical protein